MLEDRHSEFQRQVQVELKTVTVTMLGIVQTLFKHRQIKSRDKSFINNFLKKKKPYSFPDPHYCPPAKQILRLAGVYSVS